MPRSARGCGPAELLPEVGETRLADPVVSVIGRLAAIDCIFVVRSERQTDVPLAERTAIVIPPLAVRPPLLQDEVPTLGR
jgi:hypothetical protein